MTGSPLFSQRDIEAVRSAAEQMAKAANDSLKIANTSTNESQRYARFNIVRVNLEGLKRLCIQYPFLSMASLEAFESSFEKVQDETRLMTFNNSHEKIRHQVLALSPIDPFTKLSLHQQCKSLQITLELITIRRAKNQWLFDGRGFNSPESAALAYYQRSGFLGTSCEGAAPLMVMKCACLAYLKEVNIFGDPVDACMRLFEAQCHVYLHLSSYIVDQIENSSEEAVLANFREVVSTPRYCGTYPPMDEEAIVAIWRAIGPQRLAALARLFMADPYRHRSGWPDLTLAKGNELRFVEIKTSDRLHESQKALIEEILKPWNAPVSVLQIRPASPGRAAE